MSLGSVTSMAMAAPTAPSALSISRLTSSISPSQTSTSSSVTSLCSPASSIGSTASTGMSASANVNRSRDRKESTTTTEDDHVTAKDLDTSESELSVCNEAFNVISENNLNRNLSSPSQAEEKVQNAFSLLHKTLEFLVNEYGVHYALFSCYKTKERNTIVASSSAGLGSAYFKSEQGSGKNALQSWTQFCRETPYDEDLKSVAPFSSTKHYEVTSSDSGSDKVCPSPLSIDEHCSSPNTTCDENDKSPSSAVKRQLVPDGEVSDLKKFRAQLEIDSKQFGHSKRTTVSSGALNLSSFEKKSQNCENSNRQKDHQSAFMPTSDYMANGVLDFSAVKNLAAATNHRGLFSPNNLLAAASLAVNPRGVSNQSALSVNSLLGLNHHGNNSETKGLLENTASPTNASNKGLPRKGGENLQLKLEVGGNVPGRDGGCKLSPPSAQQNNRQGSNTAQNGTSNNNAQQSMPTQEQILAKGSWMCPQCMKIIKYKRNARAHLMSHAAVRPCFSCSFCDQSFTTKWNLKKHLKLNHGIDMEINDPLMNTGGSPLPSMGPEHPVATSKASPVTSTPQNVFEKQRNSILNNTAVKYFSSPLQTPPTMANLGSLASNPGFFNPTTPVDLESKESLDLKAAQQFYHNLTAKDFFSNQAEATKALQALTSVNMLMQSSLFAEQMLQFGNQFKTEPTAFDPSHLNLAAAVNLNNLAANANVSELNSRNAGLDLTNRIKATTSVDKAQEDVDDSESSSEQIEIDEQNVEHDTPLNFADCASRSSKTKTAESS